MEKLHKSKPSRRRVLTEVSNRISNQTFSEENPTEENQSLIPANNSVLQTNVFDITKTMEKAVEVSIQTIANELEEVARLTISEEGTEGPENQSWKRTASISKRMNVITQLTQDFNQLINILRVIQGKELGRFTHNHIHTFENMTDEELTKQTTEILNLLGEGDTLRERTITMKERTVLKGITN